MEKKRRTGRPSKGDDARRYTIVVCVSKRERANVRKNAVLKGMTVNHLIRESIAEHMRDIPKVVESEVAVVPLQGMEKMILGSDSILSNEGCQDEQDK